MNTSDPWAAFRTPPTPPPKQDEWEKFRRPSGTKLPEKVTKTNWEQFYTAELAAMQRMARENKLPPLSEGAIGILRDRWLMAAGMQPDNPQIEEVTAPGYYATQRNKESMLRNIAASTAGTMAAAGDIVGVVAPEAGRRMQRSIQEAYGTPQGLPGEVGQAIGGTLRGAAVGFNPALMASQFGLSGAGGTRIDVAERRAQGEEISDLQEWASAATIGAAEGLSGFISGRIVRSISPLLGSAVGPARQILADKGFKPAVQYLSKRLAKLAAGMGVEIAEEVATEWATNLTRKIGYAPETQVFGGEASIARVAGMTTLLQGGADAGAQKLARSPDAVRQKSVTQAQEQAPEQMERLQEILTPQEQRLRELEQELAAEKKAARTDPLTQLGNRKQEEEDVARIIQEADTAGESIGVVETDLANFKVLNDELGHDIGDQVLKAEAEAFQEGLRLIDRRADQKEITSEQRGEGETRPTDHVVNRLGGDEFAAKLRQIDDPAQADAIMQRVQEIFDQKIQQIIPESFPREAHPFIAWGTAIRKPGDTRSIEEIRKAADEQVIPRKNQMKSERGIPETRDQLTELVRQRREAAEQAPVPSKQMIPYWQTQAEGEAAVQAEQQIPVEGAVTPPLPDPGVRARFTPEQIAAMEGRPVHEVRAELIIDQLGGAADIVIQDEKTSGMTKARPHPGPRQDPAFDPAEGGPGSQRLPVGTTMRSQGSGMTGKVSGTGALFTQEFDSGKTAEQAAPIRPGEEAPAPTLGFEPQTTPVTGLEARKAPDRRGIPEAQPLKRGRVSETTRTNTQRVIDAVKGILNNGFNPAAGRTPGWMQTRSERRGRDAEAQLDLKKVLAKTRKLDQAGLNSKDPGVHQKIKDAILDPTGEHDLPAEVTQWASEAKRAIDEQTGYAQDVMRVVASDLKSLAQQRREAGDTKAAEALLRRATILVGQARDLPLAVKTRFKAEPDMRVAVARNIIRVRQDAENLRLWHHAVTQHGVIPPKPLSETGEERTMTREERTEWAKQNDLAVLPQLAGYGLDTEVYIPRRMAEDMRDATRLPGEIERMYLTFLRAWKSSKTVWNPATHGRNAASNALFFATLGRISPFNPRNGKYYKAAIQEYKNQEGNDFRALLQSGVTTTSYAQVEADFTGNVAEQYAASYLGRLLRATDANLGEVYGAGDNIFKLAAYKKYRAEGMTHDDAVNEVNKWMPNYANVGKWTRIMRNIPFIGAPFMSFTDQAARIGIRGVKERPVRMASIMASPVLLSIISKWVLDIDDEEQELLDMNRNTIFEPMLPFRDGKGRVATLDLRYIIPLANDLVPEMRNGSTSVPWFASGPEASLAIEQLTGTERFTGRKFIRDDMTLGEQWSARLGRFISSTAPLPPWATYGIGSVVRSARHDTSDVVALNIMGQISGINIRSPYVAEDTVREIARGLFEEQEYENMEALIHLWNESYRPAGVKMMTVSSIQQGISSSTSGQRSRAITKAARELDRGNRAKMNSLIREYNKDATRPITVSEVERFHQQKF